MKFLHSMLRVSNPDATVAFFQLLGLEERRRRDVPAGKFTLIFLGVPGDEAEVELTHNWGEEGEMAEIAAAIVTLLAPVVRQLDLGLIAGDAEEDQGELARRHIAAAALLEPKQLEKCNTGVGIRYTKHGMEEFHWADTPFIAI